MIRLYNSLSKKIEDFVPLNPSRVGMYTCGPTVYDFAHIGNFRTYTTADLLLRTLQYADYNVVYVMNLTDVGHLTGDNLGDADIGEDRIEKAAKKQGKTAWDIAKFYTDAFLRDFKRLNLIRPKLFVKATDHIPEQIELVKKLEEKDYAYKTSDGIYFDTAKFPRYGQLSSLDQIKEGARVEVNPEKKNPRDFALWKFTPQGTKRQMEWDSPWGKGFPGWHIECSAMSMKYLGESFDIHTGGLDLKETHHPNEIAQSEAASGKPFVKYWVHGAFMLVNGERMSKSLGNNYKLEDLIKKGYDPLSLRYLYLQTHYRQEMNFTFQALEAAQKALNRLREQAENYDEPKIGCAEFEEHFSNAVNNDLNMPKALSIVWDLVNSDYPTHAKAQSLLKFDKVLGLDLEKIKKGQKIKAEKIPDQVLNLVKKREELRKQKQFDLADELRSEIEKLGFSMQDKEDGAFDIKKAPGDKREN